MRSWIIPGVAIGVLAGLLVSCAVEPWWSPSATLGNAVVRALGGGVVGLVLVLVISGINGLQSRREEKAAKAALLCSIGGALVALAVWRTAYRRAPSP